MKLPDDGAQRRGRAHPSHALRKKDDAAVRISVLPSELRNIDGNPMPIQINGSTAEVPSDPSDHGCRSGRRERRLQCPRVSALTITLGKLLG